MKAFWIVAIAASSMLAGCAKETLETNEVYRSKDLVIEFKDYTDSRCPLNTNCIWEGEASVYLGVKSNGQETAIMLTGLGSDTTLFNHHIEFIDLQPYPQEGVEVAFKDKEVTLKVTKL